MHELSVWLHLIKRDSRYGLVCLDQLIETQRRHYKDVKAQLRREIALLKLSAKMKDESLDGVLKKITESPEDLTLIPKLKSVSQAIDVLASKRFSIYAKHAQRNGYDFKAYLIEAKLIPQVQQSLAKIARERKAFDRPVPRSVQNLIPNLWQWRIMAQKVWFSR